MINQENINLRTLNIDSRLRKQGRAEDLEYELQEPVEMPRGACFWVTNEYLPVVWPNVNNNIQLYIKEYSCSSETLKTINAAKGNYNLSGFAIAIESSLNDSARPFENNVTYGAVASGEDMNINLLWKGQDTRFEYTGEYEGTLERNYELAGNWVLERADGTMLSPVVFTELPSTPPNPRVWGFMGEVANGTATESFQVTISSGIWGQSLVLDILRFNGGTTTQHTYANNEFTLNGKTYYNSNVFVQPTTYVIRDPLYSAGATHEYIYKPVIDFSGDWLDNIGQTVSFIASTDPNYDVQGTHGVELIYLKSVASGPYAVSARVVTSLGTKDHLLDYNPEKKLIDIPYAPGFHSNVKLIKNTQPIFNANPQRGKIFNVTTFEHTLSAAGEWSLAGAPTGLSGVLDAQGWGRNQTTNRYRMTQRG